jgi:hypothetical protein
LLAEPQQRLKVLQRFRFEPRPIRRRRRLRQ